MRAQRIKPSAAQDIITKFRIQPKSGGPLFVTVNGTEKQIAKEALEAWIIEGGHKLAYTTSEAPGQMGAGGTLVVFDAHTNQHKKLVTSEDDLVSVKEARSGDGKTVLLLETSNAEVCAPTIGVIDPARGKVFSETPAQVLSIKGDIMILGYFKEVLPRRAGLVVVSHHVLCHCRRPVHVVTARSPRALIRMKRRTVRTTQ